MSIILIKVCHLIVFSLHGVIAHCFSEHITRKILNNEVLANKKTDKSRNRRYSLKLDTLINPPFIENNIDNVTVKLVSIKANIRCYTFRTMRLFDPQTLNKITCSKQEHAFITHYRLPLFK